MSCSCGAQNTLIVACSGGSNVGQIANDAAAVLDQLGQGRMSCLIGVGLQLPNFMEAAQKAEKIIAIDGCAVACAKIALERAGFTPNAYVVATELGIEKGHHFEHTQEQVSLVASKAAEAFAPASSS